MRSILYRTSDQTEDPVLGWQCMAGWQRVGGNAEISLTTDANTKPDAIELDETVTTSKIKLVGIESYHWQDANRNKFMNVGELDVQDTAGTTVLDKGTQIGRKKKSNPVN